MSPAEYQRRRGEIERTARLMAGNQASKDAWLRDELAKLNTEAGLDAAEGAPVMPLPKVENLEGLPPLEYRGFRSSGLEIWEFACPACRKEGGDNKGNHGWIASTGAFGCIVHPGEDGKDHRRLMLALCPGLRGAKGKFVPRPQPDVSAEKAAAAKAAAELWQAIRTELAGDLADLGNSTKIPETPKEQFLAWAEKFWKPGDLVWVGSRWDNREAFARHLFRLGDGEAGAAWQIIEREGLDHTSGVVWREVIAGRANDNIERISLLVVEHDNADWVSQIALWRYCQTELGLRLLAVVSTAGKGGHGHFDASGLSRDRIVEIIRELASLGADKNVLSRSSTRIPGAIRQRDKGNPSKPHGGRQSLLWLAE